MGLAVVNGANLMCMFGTVPSQLMVTSQFSVLAAGIPVATVSDCAPMVNIMPFGMCSSVANPQVAAATSAALGVLTPMPCMPATMPWSPTNKMAGSQPAIDSGCTCMCAYAGMISVIYAGQSKIIF